ncbi:hypothetical protein CUMW_008550 [Citrus unshiu]|nr:hypothetical protein CUMW_008550 [Citrus unshiu]
MSQKILRGAYINNRDLDVGTITKDTQALNKLAFWGNKYFKNNFKRKTKHSTLIDNLRISCPGLLARHLPF